MKNFKDKLFELAHSKTLECSAEWKAMSDEMRIEKFKNFFDENKNFDKLLKLHDIKSFILGILLKRDLKIFGSLKDIGEQ